MKYLLITALMALTAEASQSQTKISVNDKVFLKAIEWYVGMSKISAVKSPSFEQYSFDSDIRLIIFISFYNSEDSIEHRDTLISEMKALSTIYHSRYKIKVGSSELQTVLRFPPSFYFIHNGIPVVIYSGIERIALVNSNSVKQLKKEIMSQKPARYIRDVSRYIIRIDDAFANGFRGSVIAPHVEEP